MQTRSVVVTRSQSGQTVAALLRYLYRCGWSEVRRLVRGGQVQLDGKLCTNPARTLRKGQNVEFPAKPDFSTGEKKAKEKPERVKKDGVKKASVKKDNDKKDVDTPAVTEEPLAKPIIRYADKHIVIVDKPAGLTTVRHADEREEFGARAGRFLPATLADLLPDLVDRGKPGRFGRMRAVHRLDKETSGLLVFARSDAAESHLGQQMRAHSSGRKYLALVRGQPKAERIESELVRDRGDGRRGSAEKPGDGKHAVTHVKVLESLGGFALVECELETGRTHQVRIHLGERGTPLCGERIYDRPINGAPLPDTSGATRIMLHASFLQITHPATGKRLSFTAPPPADMRTLLKKLRRRSRTKE